MSLALKAAKATQRAGTSLGSVLKRTGATSAVRSQLREALRRRLAGRKGRAPMVGGRRRGRRGITATELRGFRKVAGLLNRYFQRAPAAMKRRGFKARKR